MYLIVDQADGRQMVLPVGPTPIVIGRTPGSDLTLDDPSVSARHARVTVLPDGRAILEDLGSTNGTFVNGQRVVERAFLLGGERVTVGRVDVVVSRDVPQRPAVPGATEIAPQPTMARQPGVPGPGPVAGPPQFPGGPPVPPAQFAPSQSRRDSPSVIQRVMLQRSVGRATTLAAVAVVASLAAIALLAAVILFRAPTPEATAAPSGTNGPATARTAADVAQQVEPSTVLVIATVGGKRAGNGTGWVLDAARGIIVTNQHVVNAGEGFQVGKGTMATASVVAGAPCEDLAVLKVSAGGWVSLPLGNQSKLRAGDSVIAIGYPVNASVSDDVVVTTGTVSVVQTSFDRRAVDIPQYPNVIQTSTPINPGNSGGPLVNLDGELVGVNSAGSTALQNTNYAIGVDRVKEIIPGLVAGRSLAWTGLGFDEYISAADLQSNVQLQTAFKNMGWPLLPGIVVEHFVNGRPDAFTAQLPALLTAVDKKPMDGSLPGYCDVAETRTSASTAAFTFYGANSSSSVDLTLAFR